MQPRYMNEWSTYDNARFIGGAERFDLWHMRDSNVIPNPGAFNSDRAADGESHIRVAWGDDVRRWHYAFTQNGKVDDPFFEGSRSAEINNLMDPPTREEWDFIMRYYALFAPDLGIGLVEEANGT